MITYVIWAATVVAPTFLWLRAARARDLWMLDAVAKAGRITRLERTNANLDATRDDACVEATKQRHLAQDMAAAATRQVDESERAVEGARALLKLAGLS